MQGWWRRRERDNEGKGEGDALGSIVVLNLKNKTLGILCTILFDV